MDQVGAMARGLMDIRDFSVISHKPRHSYSLDSERFCSLKAYVLLGYGGNCHDRDERIES